MKREKREKKPTPSKPKTSCLQGLQLLIVQSCVCVFALLIMVLLQLTGSDVYTELSSEFQHAMLGDSMVAAKPSLTASATVIEAEHKTKAATAVSAEPMIVCAPLNGGVITSRFGEREDPFGSVDSEIHEGVDIAAEENTPLLAMADGTVSVVSYEENGYGHYVSVKTENGCKYVYAHCSAVLVTEGQTVKAGDTIARVGNSGRSTGHHVHIEWIVDETPVDPLSVLPESTYA